MFQHIVIAYDDSPGARLAVARAVDQAADGAGARLRRSVPWRAVLIVR